MIGPRLTPELKCDNYEVSLKFYTEVLGFDVLYQRESHGFVMLSFEGANLMLDRDDAYFKQQFPEGTPKPYGRGINFQIETADVKSLYANVQKHNWPISTELEEVWYRANDIESGNNQFCVNDPDGYLLRFFESLGERPVLK